MAWPFNNTDGFVPFLSDENASAPFDYDPGGSFRQPENDNSRYIKRRSFPSDDPRDGTDARALSDDGDKTMNASKLAELRAKLIARRNTPSGTPLSGDTPHHSGNSAAAFKPEAKEQAAMSVASGSDSRMDIDGLLAEGRAAADAKSKAKQISQPKNQNDRKENLTIETILPKQTLTQKDEQTPFNKNPTNHQLGESTDSVEAGEIRDDAALTSSTTVNATENFKTPTNPRARPEAKDAAPQKTNSPKSANSRPIVAEESRHVSETRPPPSARLKTMSALYGQDQGKSESDSSRPISKTIDMSRTHETSLGSELPPSENHRPTTTDSNIQIPDHLREWLELTGWFDFEYRERVLERHRRRKQLSYEMAKLAQEEAADKDYLTRAHSTNILEPYRSSSKPSALDNSGQALAGASSFSVEPRLENSKKRSLSPKNDIRDAREPAHKLVRSDNANPLRKETEPRPRRDEDRSGYRIKGAVDDYVAQRPLSSRKPERAGRSLSPRPREFSENRPTYREDRYEGNRASDYDRRTSQNELFGEKPARKYAQYDRYDKHPGSAQNHHGSFRDDTRLEGPPKTSARIVGTKFSKSDDALSLELSKGDVRFFMIKSWNHDNVEAAKNDGTWATQEKNADILTEAFNNSRHVILVFSVNKSMAFQGYARMETLPGTAKAPVWAEDLHWKTSPPFRIRWITIAETHFRLVGHLKNSYNDGQAVLVGRDGQEIEAHCGAELCRLIGEQSQFDRDWLY